MLFRSDDPWTVVATIGDAQSLGGGVLVELDAQVTLRVAPLARA